MIAATVKRATGIGLAVACLHGLFEPPAFGQQPAAKAPWEAVSDWTYYNNTGWTAFNRGRYDRAEQAFRLGIKRLEPYESEHKVRVMVARSRGDLAKLYVALKRYDEAEPMIRSSLKVREESPGEKSESLIQNLQLLAQIHRVRNRHAEATPLLRRALDLQVKNLGPDHPDVTPTLEALAEVHAAQRNHALAESFYRRALALREANTEVNVKKAESLEQSANILRQLTQVSNASAQAMNSQLNQAERLESQARTLRAATNQSVGHAAASEGLARVLHSTGRDDEADELEARARELRDRIETLAARARAGR